MSDRTPHNYPTNAIALQNKPKRDRTLKQTTQTKRRSHFQTNCLNQNAIAFQTNCLKQSAQN
ncbi:MAG: hypothetical protein KME54_16870 [Tolypothrix brevis GSE-NOS-MK-07-07A]|nr:hypothetical protein [Tolypothrix brevis GSE-NOS-MK-07-07A]